MNRGRRRLWFILHPSAIILSAGEVPCQQRLGHLDGGYVADRCAPLYGNRFYGGGPWWRLAQLLQLVQDFIEGESLDELHDVVVQPVVLSDSVNRHDVRVVQP